MAIDISATARLLLDQRNISPNLILEIDGIDTIYGAIDIFEIARFDTGLAFDEGWKFDSLVQSANAKNYISLSSSGNTIQQQLLQDKGVQSITTFKVDLIDKNQEITQLITPGVVLEEILGVKARVYISVGGTHPEDSILVHRGIISTVESSPASVSITIDSPERLKHQEIFIQQKTKLNGALNNSATTITVDSTENYLLPADTASTYIQIDDEIIQYTGKTDTTFTGCTRGSLGTTAATHDDNTEVSSVYRLQDDAITLALKLMMSQAEDIEDVAIQEYGDDGTIYFSDYNIQEKIGLTIGDFISTTGSDNASNDLTLVEITGFGRNSSGSWIETGATTVSELSSPAVASFRSQYNVWPDGLGMTSQDVDVERHEFMLTTYSNEIPDYDFRLKDTIKSNEFLNDQVYYQAGFYSLPRKSKASVGKTSPPLADQTVVYLDESNVVKPSQIKTSRGTNRNFYNAIIFKYDKGILDDEYGVVKIRYSADSQNRIKNTGNKVITIESDGLRDSTDTTTVVTNLQRRILDRYQFAAESFPAVQIFGKDGVPLEVGDVVVFGSRSLGISDTTIGSRNFVPKLYEVVNKSLNVKTLEVRTDLLQTAFELDGRYGIVSPSSYVDTGSTTTNIVIRDSFSTQSPAIEKDKWLAYVGEKIRVHSVDYSFDETVTLTAFDPSNDYIMQVTPALSAPPSSGYIVDAPAYDDTSAVNQATWKLIHVFFDPQVQVDSGVSNTSFNLTLSDAAKLHVGSIIRVHNRSFSVDSGEVEVTDITGTLITVDTSLGFTPTSSEYVDLIGFDDGGLPYRLV